MWKFIMLVIIYVVFYLIIRGTTESVFDYDNELRKNANKFYTRFLNIIIIILALFLYVAPMSKLKNELVSKESQIECIDLQLMNLHSSNFKVIKSLTKNYKIADKDLEEITKLYVDGRKISQNALFVVMNEKVPNMNKDLIIQLNDTISKNYSNFYTMQNHKVELIRDYKIELNKGIFRPIIVKMLGFPKIKLDVNLLLMENTRKSFESGNDIIVE